MNMYKESLNALLEQQSDKNKSRYPYRNPAKTIEFFGLKPGMTIVEALPSEGWYSKILLPYLGKEGKLIGVDYSFSMWPNFDFVDNAFLEKRKNWAINWPKEAAAWYPEGETAPVSAYTFSTLSSELSETADAVLFIRALHSLSSFENKGEYLSKALKESHRVLKSGGILGVVQHSAPEDKSDTWADGSRGYLKKSSVIKMVESAGFRFSSEGKFNENEMDLPGDDDIVWRLPPTLHTSDDNEALKSSFLEIGESNRMTLLFHKLLTR